MNTLPMHIRELTPLISWTKHLQNGNCPDFADATNEVVSKHLLTAYLNGGNTFPTLILLFDDVIVLSSKPVNLDPSTTATATDPTDFLQTLRDEQAKHNEPVERKQGRYARSKTAKKVHTKKEPNNNLPTQQTLQF